MRNKNILISGAGIAGMALAFWLKKYGFNPTVVELSPKLREGGYAIDFFGSGFDVAEKMQILDDLQKVDLKMQQVVFVDENDNREGSLNAFRIREMTNYRFYNLLRSDLSRVIYNHLDKDTPLIFGDSISSIQQNNEDVTVSFHSGIARSFDLVVGADGLHSKVRSLIFGNESQFEKFFGYYTSSFTVANSIEKENLFRSYTEPGKQISIYPLRENKLATLFIFSSPTKLTYDYHDIETQKEILKDEFRNMKWKCPLLLEKLDDAPDFYFDSVSQIKMGRWSDGRITLVGDACDCPSLLSGQGSSLAMVGAYILAGELKEANGNYSEAFEKYENIFKPLIEEKQKLAKSFGNSLVPKSNFGIWLRNTFTNFIFSSFAAKWLVKKFMTDKIDLKEY